MEKELRYLPVFAPNCHWQIIDTAKGNVAIESSSIRKDILTKCEKLNVEDKKGWEK